jgi:hypothetical protein
MELVLVELDAGTELDATECVEVVDAELVSGTNIGSGRGRRIERGRDRSASPNGWQAARAEFVPRAEARRRA